MAENVVTLCVGDTHLKQHFILPRVDAAVRRFGVERVVFLGDLCDDWGARDDFALSALREMADWVLRARDSGLRVDVLAGNHDMCYLMDIEGPGTQYAIMPSVRHVLRTMDVRIAADVNGWLATHAGVTGAWADDFLPGVTRPAAIADALDAMARDVYGEDIYALYSCGCARGGDDAPGPVWADRRELMADPLPGVNQIVGHTPVGACMHERVSSFGGAQAGMCDLWFCDTFSLASTFSPIGDASMLLVDAGGSARAISTDELIGRPWLDDVFAYADSR